MRLAGIRRAVRDRVTAHRSTELHEPSNSTNLPNQRTRRTDEPDEPTNQPD
jgi:hypothetical protein